MPMNKVTMDDVESRTDPSEGGRGGGGQVEITVRAEGNSVFVHANKMKSKLCWYQGEILKT